MKRRTLLQSIAALAASLPLERVRLFAQPRELTADAISFLHQIAATVLPASIGEQRRRAVVDGFVRWTREYQEGVALAHGYGHPRLQKSGPTPVPRYLTQLSALQAAAERSGGSWTTRDRETQRALLDAAFAASGVRALPPRPAGQHVVADLMAFYFRSTEANDDCYRARIQREVCRPIQITTRRPDPL